MYNRVLVGVLLAASLLVSGCGNSNKESKELIRKVKVAKVTRTSPELTKEFSGIIKEAKEVNLAFRVAGKIEKILVKEGDYVREGDLIAMIDPRDYEIQAAVAKAQYEQVKAEASRVNELYNRKSIAENDYDKAVAGEKMLSSKLKHANDQLNDTKLYAPFSGYIQNINYDNGEMINTGFTLATIINVEHYSVEVDIPASLFIQKDKFVSFACQQSMIDNKEFPLSMVSYNKKANSNQLYRLYFRLDPRKDKRLAPGMDVKVTINYQNKSENDVIVPVNAIFNKDGKSYVWIYNSDSKTVISKEVKIDGLAGKGFATIESGLNGNEIIVVAGVNILKENQRVDILDNASDTNVGGLL